MDKRRMYMYETRMYMDDRSFCILIRGGCIYGYTGRIFKIVKSRYTTSITQGGAVN